MNIYSLNDNFSQTTKTVNIVVCYVQIRIFSHFWVNMAFESTLKTENLNVFANDVGNIGLFTSIFDAFEHRTSKNAGFVPPASDHSVKEKIIFFYIVWGIVSKMIKD